MGLTDLVDEDDRSEIECPGCEKEGEGTEHYYNRCNNPNCTVTNWIPTNYETDFDI